MIRYFKPARNKEYIRGYFSYMKESVINLFNSEENHPNQEIKIFHDLNNIPGYGEGNLYEICFEQDNFDFIENRNEYSNIENEKWHINDDEYNSNLFNLKIRKKCESIIQKYYRMTSEINYKIISRHSEIDFTKTIGFHRRATDMEYHHGFRTIDLEEIFKILEKEQFEYIFLMSDNLEDLRKIKNRYGKRIITYDEFTSSDDTHNPFHKKNILDKSKIKNHVEEIMFGALTLGKTKKLFCTLSNLTGFSILSNSELKYEILK